MGALAHAERNGPKNAGATPTKAPPASSGSRAPPPERTGQHKGSAQPYESCQCFEKRGMFRKRRPLDSSLRFVRAIKQHEKRKTTKERRQESTSSGLREPPLALAHERGVLPLRPGGEGPPQR